MTTIDIRELAFPFSSSAVQLDVDPFENRAGPVIKVVVAKRPRNRATLIAIPHGAAIPQMENWGVQLIERLAETLGIAMDVAFRPAILYRDSTGQLSSLILQHALSKENAITRAMFAIPLKNCNTPTVEQQISELLPHFGDDCRLALKWALS